MVMILSRDLNHELYEQHDMLGYVCGLGWLELQNFVTVQANIHLDCKDGQYCSFCKQYNTITILCHWYCIALKRCCRVPKVCMGSHLIMEGLFSSKLTYGMTVWGRVWIIPGDLDEGTSPTMKKEDLWKLQVFQNKCLRLVTTITFGISWFIYDTGCSMIIYKKYERIDQTKKHHC